MKTQCHFNITLRGKLIIRLLSSFVLLFAGAAAAHAIPFTGNSNFARDNQGTCVNAGGGNLSWSDPKNWGPPCEPAGPPGPGSSAEIIDATVFLDIPATVGNLTLGGSGNGGSIDNSGGGSLTVTNRLEMSRGGIGSPTNLNVVIPSTGTLVFSGPSAAIKIIGGNVTIHNSGRIEWTGGAVYFNGTLNNSGTFVITGDAGFGHPLRTGVINNTGSITKEAGAGKTQFSGFTPETNSIATAINNNGNGVVEVKSGTIEMGRGTSNGEFKVGAGKTLLISDGHTFNEATFTGAGTCSLAGTMTFLGHINSTVDLELVAGGILGGDATNPGAFLEGNGRLFWKGGRIAGPFTFAEQFRTVLTGPDRKDYDGAVTNKGTMSWFGPGALAGINTTFRNEGTFNVLAAGTFLADRGINLPTFENVGTLNTFPGGTSQTADMRIVNSGVVNIGGFNRAGILSIGAGFTQTATGTLYMEVGGTNAATPEFDQLTGSSIVDGTLVVDVINNYTPPKDARFVLMNNRTGQFARVFTPGGTERSRIEYPSSRTELLSLSDAPIPLRLWGAGRDLARNESPDRASEAAAINESVPQWSYGHRATAGGTNLTLFTPEQHVNDASSLHGWIAPGQATLGVNTKSTPIVFNTGSGDYKPLFRDQIYLSPGSGNEFLVARWTAPAAGDYRIVARWLDLDNHGGNGVTAHLFKNGQEQFVQTFQSTTTATGRARLRALTLSLNAGDVLDFVVGSNGEHLFDATAFNAAVRRVPKVTTAAAPEITLTEGQDLTIDAAVDVPVTSVALSVDGETVERKLTAFGQFVVRLEVGTHFIRLTATDDRQAPGTTAPVKVRVENAGSANRSAARTAKAAKPGKAATAAATSGGKTYYCQQSGFWNEPTTWSPLGVPGINDSAVIAAGFEVTLTGETNVDNLECTGRINVASFVTDHVLRVYGICSLAGELRGPMQFILPVGSKFYTPGGSLFLTDVQFFNNGSLVLEGSGVVTERTILINNGRMSIAPLPGTQNPVVVGFDSFDHNGGQLLAKPNVAIDAPQGVRLAAPVELSHGSAPLISDNGAALIGNAGGTLIGLDGGTLIGLDGGTLIGLDGGTLIGLDGGTLLDPQGAPLIGDYGSGFLSEHGGALRSRRPSSGERLENTETTPGTILLAAGGTITGTGELRGNVVNQGAFLAPGNSAGGIIVNGDYTQEAGGTLVLEIGGKTFAPLSYDVFQVAGTANLGGNLVVKTINGYTPASGDTVLSILYGNHTGNFASISSNAQVTLGAKGAQVTTNGPNPQGPRALNISTRLQIQPGDKALFASFIITGPAGSTKKVLIRGLGPSLTKLGVAGAIQDPFLELHTSGATITNDNWQQAPNANEIPSGFAPSDPRESLILATLAPGQYSAILTGKGGEIGVGLAEVYDLEENSPAQLANIATRGVVQTDDNVLIGGFIIAGKEPTRVVVRAVGPSLAAFNLTGVLLDPELELHDSNGGLIGNDAWRSTQEVEIKAAGFQLSDDREPAVFATLTPGHYTAVVRGKNNTTGIAVVEVYNLQ